jgi:CheY-like chemotaxis protein
MDVALRIETMKKRILIVEDNGDLLEVLVCQVVCLGYEPMMAKDGLEAVEIATSENPDLIIMDMLLPKLSGMGATVQIRNSSPKAKLIPILAATARAMPGDREQCLRGGCDGYLAKPFTQEELGEAIEKLLKKPSPREDDRMQAAQ